MLELRRVSKRFSGIDAVDDVSFSAQPREVTGYLGPNGSGKSTTMKMITGLMEMTSGEILFEGDPIQRDLMSFNLSHDLRCEREELMAIGEVRAVLSHEPDPRTWEIRNRHGVRSRIRSEAGTAGASGSSTLDEDCGRPRDRGRSVEMAKAEEAVVEFEDMPDAAVLGLGLHRDGVLPG
jgi:ABC-type cobalamin/Fe3+-siderophores transport system ATPase subunit